MKATKKKLTTTTKKAPVISMDAPLTSSEIVSCIPTWDQEYDFEKPDDDDAYDIKEKIGVIPEPVMVWLAPQFAPGLLRQLTKNPVPKTVREQEGDICFSTRRIVTLRPIGPQGEINLAAIPTITLAFEAYRRRIADRVRIVAGAEDALIDVGQLGTDILELELKRRVRL
jgi:hypothetical protein